MGDMNEMKRKTKDMGSDAKMKAKNVANKAENMKEKGTHRIDEMRDKHKTM